MAAILGIGQICSWGTLYYSFPLIVLGMEQDLGWTKAQLYAGATLGLLVTAMLSYPVGVGIDRGWGKWIMGGASLAAMAVLGWWSVTESLLAFYVICALSGAVQAAILYEPAFAVLARRVGPANARGGITHITLWGGFASTVFVPVTGTLITHFDWRTTLLLLGLVNVVYGLIYLATIRPDKDIEHAQNAQMRHEHAMRDRQIVRDNLRSRLFWILLIALTVYAGSFSAFTFHMYPMLQEKGLSESDVVLAIAVIGPAQVVGRILITVFAREMPLRIVGAILIGVFPVTFALLYPAILSVWTVAILFAVYGLVNGIFTIVRSFMVPEMLSKHAYGALNGIINVCATIARAIMPLAAAWIWEAGQSYQPVIAAIAGLSVLLAATFWLAVWWSRPARISQSQPRQPT
ncbi:MFS transporter [Orrella marina]|uniref:MFS transporter n=1 Tax=Orrella marina TaxID=2163011 RepID=A0A2R4XQ73_9BURK|nr:MFS transporter [Orrella marina]